MNNNINKYLVTRTFSVRECKSLQWNDDKSVICLKPNKVCGYGETEFCYKETLIR